MRLSANVRDLKPSATIAVSTLAKRLAAEGRDIINLSAGEPDFDTPSFVSDAAIAGIRAGRTRYTPPAGVPELRKAIAARLSERAGHDLPWEGVVVSSGAKQALFNSIFCLFGPGDHVLVAAPFWTSYPDLVTIARAIPLPVSGPEADGFKISPAVLDTARTDATRGLILNTPCNPTGAVYSLSELRAIAEWARANGVVLISDEIYRNIYYGNDRPAAAGILDLAADRVGDIVLIDGASKSYAMTGWRIGFSYCEPDLAAKFTSLQSQITSNAATPSQMAALAAFSDAGAADASVHEMGRAFRRRRDLVTTRLGEVLPDVSFVEPEGAFYLYFRVDGLFDDGVTDATAWCSRLLKEQGVALVPGAAFGDDRWVRMSYAASDDSLEEAFRRIGALVGAGTSA